MVDADRDDEIIGSNLRKDEKIVDDVQIYIDYYNNRVYVRGHKYVLLK